MPDHLLDYPLELLARVLDSSVQNPGGARVRRISTDSRTLEPEDLFFALSGENFDGHRYVLDALAKGAVAAVVDPERLTAADGRAKSLIAVPDPLLALGALAAWYRSRFQVRMVAVTGSVGKTTT